MNENRTAPNVNEIDGSDGSEQMERAAPIDMSETGSENLGETTPVQELHRSERLKNVTKAYMIAELLMTIEANTTFEKREPKSIRKGQMLMTGESRSYVSWMLTRVMARLRLLITCHMIRRQF